MKNEEDKELESIKRAKLQELMKKSKASEKEAAVLNKPIEVTDPTFKEMIQNLFAGSGGLLGAMVWSMPNGCSCYRGAGARLCWENLI